MEVTGILAPGSIEEHKFKQWQLGERLLVEVIQKNGESEGTIRVKGQILTSVLETSTHVGDKFWVQVGEVKEGYLLLLREPQSDQLQNIQVNSLQFQELTERGLPLNRELATLIREFPISEGEASIFKNIQGVLSDELLTNLRKSFPKWEYLSKGNGAEEIVECLRKLGINYEHRLQQMGMLDSKDKELEKESIKSTLKFSVLTEINKQTEEKNFDPEGPLASLLDKITGQQLWYKTGTLNNGYVLLQLPLMNQEQFMSVKIGIESARKGLKMDEKHCRVAIQLETDCLGVIGIDAFFNQDSMNINVLSHDHLSLPEVIEEVLPETKIQFARLGFMLTKVGTEDLDHNLEFQQFLQGLRRSGVDIEG